MLSRCLFNNKNKLVCQERPEKSGRIFALDIPAFYCYICMSISSAIFSW